MRCTEGFPELKVIKVSSLVSIDWVVSENRSEDRVKYQLFQREANSHSCQPIVLIIEELPGQFLQLVDTECPANDENCEHKDVVPIVVAKYLFLIAEDLFFERLNGFFSKQSFHVLHHFVFVK